MAVDLGDVRVTCGSDSDSADLGDVRDLGEVVDLGWGQWTWGDVRGSYSDSADLGDVRLNGLGLTCSGLGVAGSELG